MAVNVNGKSIKLLEDNIREYFSQLWDRKDFLSLIQMPLIIKEKIVTLGYIKIKNFSSSK